MRRVNTLELNSDVYQRISMRRRISPDPDVAAFSWYNLYGADMQWAHLKKSYNKQKDCDVHVLITPHAVSNLTLSSSGSGGGGGLSPSIIYS